MSYIQNLLQLLDQSPTSFHVVENLQQDLLSKSYQELKEGESWDLKPATKYFVTRAGGSIAIFHTPKNFSASSSFKVIGTHTDFPGFKIKANPFSSKEGFQLLNVEVYGGVILNSWFDRDLQIAGRVFYEDAQGVLQSKNVKLNTIVSIPRLAIHLDREVNREGFKPNPQEHMFPVMGLAKDLKFEDWIAEENTIDGKILSWDLFLFDAQAASLGGINEEFIYAQGLDNVASVHASYEAILASDFSENDIQIAVAFQHEEIGSQSQNGANSNFLEAVLKRIAASTSASEQDYYAIIANSFCISADMTHGVHPNYSSLHDPNHKPKIGGGPVIKSNANMRYASDAFSVAKFKQWCYKAEVPVQDFCSRNDVGCGSTIGPMTAAKIGIPTLDIGNPMLSMHSIREMSGTKDHEMLIDVFKEFYK